MHFEEDLTQPDPTRWTPDGTWPEHMLKGAGLFDEFVVMPQVSGYFRLYFSTPEGFDHVGDYYHFADLEEAALQLLGAVAHLPSSEHASAH